MIDSKEINKFAFPLVLTNIGQVIIGQIALHFAVNNSSIALSGISIIQNLLFAFGGLFKQIKKELELDDIENGDLIRVF